MILARRLGVYISCGSPGLTRWPSRRLLCERVPAVKMKIALSLLGLALACYASDLPVVDLGYELHKAFSLNVCIFPIAYKTRRI